MTTFRVHFDGSVFVPDEPVPLPPNVPLRITVVADDHEETPLARISHCAKKRTAFLSHKLLVNGNFGKNKEAVRWLQSVANDRSISSPWRRGR